MFPPVSLVKTLADRLEALRALLTKLNSIGHLGDEDRQALDALPIQIKALENEQHLLREGDRPTQCCILLSGWACRHKSLAGGQRQILSLHLPGDLIDLQSLDMPVMDHTITALTEVQVACVPHAAMRALLLRSPTLSSILWRVVLIEAAIGRQWLLNMGQRNAPQRIAHLICEMTVRMQSVGLSYAMLNMPSFSWPLTQLRLGQATGLSAVHVNRSLQELRAKQLLVLKSSHLTVLDWPGLTALAEFDPDYLGLMQTFDMAA